MPNLGFGPAAAAALQVQCLRALDCRKKEPWACLNLCEMGLEK
jgi:hypothetical protein